LFENKSPLLQNLLYNRIGYGLDDWGSIPGGGNDGIFCHLFETGSGTHPPSYLMGTGRYFLGDMTAGGEVEHSHPFNAEVKNAWSYTSTHSLRIHDMILS
jgi:hypothetical protein